MNHTYRLVWNDLINAFVAVSELTKGRGKRTSPPSPASGRGSGSEGSTLIDLNTPLKLTLLAAATALATFAQAADPLPTTALPTGAQLAGGQAAVAQTGARMDITQSSDRAILNWQSFNIGQSAHVKFNQPSASAVTLNRVVGGDPSQILGRMTANGQVFLSNPNGIYFGKNTQIDVAGLVATTHNIRDHDFMAGRNDFTIPGNPGASVINEGQIRIADTGIAAFVAPSVANRGVIAAKLGKIQLAAANGFTLDFNGDDLLTFMVDDKVAQTALDQNGQPLNSFVESSGRIEAEGGYVWLTAKAAEGAVHSAINHSGVVEANRVDNQGGVIVLSGGEHGLVTVSGKLDASGQCNAGKGCEISITGETVHLVANATLDASGQEGGGTILVGGDHMGGNLGADAAEKYSLHLEKRSIANAKNVLVEEGVVLNASALERGDGGKVVIWADEATEFRGDIFARGGAAAGNGGIVEISGGKRVLALGTTDVSAPAGKKGFRLIDPAGSLYSTTAEFFAELDDTAVARIVDMHQDTDNALYILSVKKKASNEFRVDPDGAKAYLADIILTKIQNGEIVAQTLIDTLYATYGTETNSGLRGALQVSGSEVTVFFNEKTATSNNYGQNGYRYRLSKTTLDSTTAKETLFTALNWGWFPYFDGSGNINHFSFDRYNAVSNTNIGAFIWPSDFEKVSYAARLANGDITGDVNTLTWDLLSESLLSQAQQIVQISDSGNPINDNNNPIDVDTPDIPDGTTPDSSNPGRPGDAEADPESPPTAPVELCKAGDIVCAGGIRIVPGIEKPDVPSEDDKILPEPVTPCCNGETRKEPGSDPIILPPIHFSVGELLKETGKSIPINTVETLNKKGFDIISNGIEGSLSELLNQLTSQIDANDRAIKKLTDYEIKYANKLKSGDLRGLNKMKEALELHQKNLNDVSDGFSMKSKNYNLLKSKLSKLNLLKKIPIITIAFETWDESVENRELAELASEYNAVAEKINSITDKTEAADFVTNMVLNSISLGGIEQISFDLNDSSIMAKTEREFNSWFSTMENYVDRLPGGRTVNGMTKLLVDDSTPTGVKEYLYFIMSTANVSE